MNVEQNVAVSKAEELILRVARERVAHGIEDHDKDTLIAGALLLAEIEAGRDVEFSKILLEHLYRGFVTAELLLEEDVDDERAALDTPYGECIGDYLLHVK